MKLSLLLVGLLSAGIAFADLPALMPGYAHTPAAARAILAYLEARVPVNAAIKAAILERAGE